MRFTVSLSTPLTAHRGALSAERVSLSNWPDVRMARMSDRRPDLPNRQIPFTDAFKKFIAEGWAPYPTHLPAQLPAAAWSRQRRERVSAQFPGERLVIPAGGLKARSNDPDSAGCQFFICDGDASFLDQKYTAFGTLIRGDDVLSKISSTPVSRSASGENSKPQERIEVKSVKIVAKDSLK